MAVSLFVMTATSAETDTNKSNSKKAQIKQSAITSVSSDDLVVIVREGDSLYRILRGNLGSISAVNEVVLYNKLGSPDSLEPGDIIRIPSRLLTKPQVKWDVRISEQSRLSGSNLETPKEITPHDTSTSGKNNTGNSNDLVVGKRLVVDESSTSNRLGNTTTETAPPKNVLLATPPQPQELLLQRVVVEGNTAISDAQLATITGPYLNRPLRFSDLEQMRVDITRAYTDQGYISSGAVLPDQKVTNGQLVYRVIEGRLDEIEVSGAGRLKPAYVANRVRAAAGIPFNSNKLQEAFQLLLDDPLIERMDGQLLPQPGTGLTKLKLAVVPSAPWLLSLTADNHGSPSVGKEQLAVAGTYLNPTGIGDRADLSVSLSPGRYNVSGSYSAPINAQNTRLVFDYGATNSTVIEEPLNNIDIESDSTNLGVSLIHPLTRSVSGGVEVGADFTVRNNSNTLLGEPFSFSAGEEDGESRVAALRLWQDFTRRRSQQVIALRSSFNFGVDAFGSTVHDDNLPDSEFISWLGQLRLVRSLQDGAGNILLKANAQYANELLLPLERFALGGADNVRGYRKNQLVRDNALFLSAEYQYSFYQSPSAGEWKVAPFVDYGQGRNKGAEANSETLTSTGIGLLWSKEKFNADLYIGHTIESDAGNTESGLQHDGVHFRFSTNFF